MNEEINNKASFYEGEKIVYIPSREVKRAIETSGWVAHDWLDLEPYHVYTVLSVILNEGFRSPNYSIQLLNGTEYTFSHDSGVWMRMFPIQDLI